MATHQDLSNFIWQIADLLRGPYRPPQYERVMLPMTVLRRFDCVLADTKPQVLKRYNQLKDGKTKNLDSILNTVAGGGIDLGFHNHSELDFTKLKGDPDNVGRHLVHYIEGFSQKVYEIFQAFEFEKEIEKLEEANRLYQVVAKFADVDLHPDRVDNIAMGLVFEDLIRRFNEAANETAGDHFTPREVIRLMVNVLLEPDEHILTEKGVIATVFDPACGTGGMLSEAQNWIREHNPGAVVNVYGQDYNPRSFAIAASDLLIKRDSRRKDRDLSTSRIERGNTLIDDKFEDIPGFDYHLANPPFGVDWKAEQKEIEKLTDFRGYGGKLPRVNDGAFLFLLHMIGKFQPHNPAEKKHGSRCAVVFNGSPLFTGGAGSGESEIRRWIIERDMLEAIIALPDQMFYNTGIGTFIWIVTNRKVKARRGKIQLVDVRDRWEPMRRSLGKKRRYLSDEIIAEVTREHGVFRPTATSKIFDNSDFGYRRVTIERPLRLRFQITEEAKEKFLDAVPEFFDALVAMEREIGTDPLADWNEAWTDAQRIARANNLKWTASSRKLFRQCFTVVDPKAKPVIASERKGATIYVPDPALRDFENVPLKEGIDSYFDREVAPFMPDAWIDREMVDESDGEIGKVGYEINFNQRFFQYSPPRELEEIDAELDAAENRILKLRKHAATRARIVTRGLDPKIRMKPSGLEWTGDIPTHWKVVRLKHIAQIGNGSTPNVDNFDYWQDGDFPWLNSSVVGDRPVKEPSRLVTELALRECHLPIISPPAVLVAITGQGKTRGRSTVLEFEATINQHLAFVKPERGAAECLYLSLLLDAAYTFLRSDSDGAGSTRGAITCEQLGNFRVPLPPIDEQRSILSHIDDSVRHFAEVEKATADSIALLRERRSAVITAAVTGAIPLEGMT